MGLWRRVLSSLPHAQCADADESASPSPAATSNKLATSFTNGAVVLWDLAKEGGSRVEQLKYEHDRAVNRVVFGGQTGNWLMSGGQDGQMKLWVRPLAP